MTDLMWAPFIVLWKLLYMLVFLFVNFPWLTVVIIGLIAVTIWKVSFPR